MALATLDTLSNDDLLTHVRRLTARSNVTLADLLAHLGEVERRGIHRLRACASLQTYCIYELRMSEDAAYRRAKAARLVREFPELHGVIAKGELHLTGLLMIAPLLGGEHHNEVLARARFRSKREIARLIARLDPKPEVPPLVQPLGPALAGHPTHAAFVESLAGPVRNLPTGERPEDWIDEGDSAAGDNGEPENSRGRASLKDLAARVATEESGEQRAESLAARPGCAPLSLPPRPLHYKVQFTANQEFVDLLEEAFDLLSHETRKRDLAAVQLQAMRAFVARLRKRKRAATDRRNSEPADASGHPAPARKSGSDPHPARDSNAPARDSGSAPQPAPAPQSGGSHRNAPAQRSEPKRREPPAGNSRHIPSAVARAVWARDENRCAYVDARGHRCQETRALELHHRIAFALGGRHTADNLEVRCRAHNVLAAEHDFGRAHMERMRVDPIT